MKILHTCPVARTEMTPSRLDKPVSWSNIKGKIQKAALPQGQRAEKGRRRWRPQKLNASCSTHSSSRVWMSGHESLSFGSEYILNKILKVQARLLVSCFSRFGLDLPLKPEQEKQKVSAGGEGWLGLLPTSIPPCLLAWGSSAPYFRLVYA